MANPEAYWKTLASRGTHKNVIFKEEALKEYKGNFASHEAVHAVSHIPPFPHYFLRYSLLLIGVYPYIGKSGV